MNVFWIILFIPFVMSSISENLAWNYPYYNLDKFLSYLIPQSWKAEQYFNSDGSYFFKYDTGYIHQSFRGETRDKQGVVQGYYGYIDEDGVLRITEYISDNLGFRVKTTLRYQVYTNSGGIRFPCTFRYGFTLRCSIGIEKYDKSLNYSLYQHCYCLRGFDWYIK